MMSFRDKISGFINKMSNPNIGRQYYGTSPLQQAMAQEASGNITPQAQELLNYHRQNNMPEMDRQRDLMASGKHGDYGIDRRVTPMFTDATTELLPANKQGAEEYTASSPASVDPKEPEAVNQRLMLDRFMKDPSKLNSEGVKSMQTMLNSLGFRDKNGEMLKVDGKMGPLTASSMDAYRGQYGQGVAENNEPLAEVPVVSGTMRAGKYGQGYEAEGVSPIYDPYYGKNEWEQAQDPRSSMDYGYQNIQQTIGNPDNDPVMWGVDELSSLTNPLQFDYETGFVKKN